MVTRHKSAQKSTKESKLQMTPDTTEYKSAGTPGTWASSNQGSAESSYGKQKSYTSNVNEKLASWEQEFKQPKTCFKNLFDSVPNVDDNSSNSKDESVRSNITEYLTMDEFCFDFDYAPVQAVSQVDLQFENLISLNYLQSTPNEGFLNSHEFGNFDCMGDRLFPLSCFY